MITGDPDEEENVGIPKKINAAAQGACHWAWEMMEAVVCKQDWWQNNLYT